MRVFCAVMMVALLAGPAVAQTQQPVPKYGDPDKDKTQTELESERQAERAYKRSLGNVPDAGPTDPWGNVRSDGGAKAKPAPAKRAKTDGPAKSSEAAK
jgi:hypothetical protein